MCGPHRLLRRKNKNNAGNENSAGLIWARRQPRGWGRLDGEGAEPTSWDAHCDGREAEKFNQARSSGCASWARRKWARALSPDLIGGRQRRDASAAPSESNHSAGQLSFSSRAEWPARCWWWALGRGDELSRRRAQIDSAGRPAARSHLARAIGESHRRGRSDANYHLALARPAVRSLPQALAQPQPPPPAPSVRASKQ